MKWSFACVSLHGRKSMEAIKENWTTIKEAVRREYSLSDISYHTWVEPLEFHNVVNDVVSIIIPSDQAHALNYISSKYKSFFQVTITEMFDHPYDISFILEKDVTAIMYIHSGRQWRQLKKARQIMQYFRLKIQQREQ